MNADKLKQYIGLFGGLASAVFLFLHTIGIQFTWFNPASIGAFSGVLVAAIPFVLIVYGVYKNSYILTEKAKKQEKELKRRGLK
ncbi:MULTISPECIES: phage holin [Sporosarcina]|uniref:phage holin n=1 Tax=Sporosarcina TaxID=1569 RepID=UPI00057A8B73|nr:phage holin [Sporosarcina sp. ZBG7A]MCM3757316.1 SPP1 phage holin family protein [Sporosarcina aquimarina]